MKRYQDRVTPDGQTVSGYRECAGRYAVVLQAIRALALPQVSVLDVGAAGGYFSQRLAQDLGARCTAVDSAPELRRAVGDYGRGSVAAVHQRLTPAQLAALPRADVVLGLSLLHHNEDWRQLLDALRGRARRLLVLEVPDPREPLRVAAARAELGPIYQAATALGPVLGHGQAVWSDHQRPIIGVRAAALRGTVFSGSGNCGRFWSPLITQLARTLGYEPFPGSLNVRLRLPLHAPENGLRLYLGAPARMYWDRRRAPSGKRGGDYQFWAARFGTGPHSTAGHVMLPGVRTHGMDGVELVASTQLRDAWDLEDGSPLWIQLR